MIAVEICPVCQSSKWHKVYPVFDHSISKEEFYLIECQSCGLVATSPRPDDSSLSKYYQSDKYVSHSGQSNNLENRIYLQARKIALRWKLSLIKSLKPTGSLLDIGCGTGEFLKTVQDANSKISGIEPSSTARSKAEQLLKQPIFDSIEVVDDSFDVITLWHVLEHVPNLNQTLNKINQLLKSDGRLLIAVPNHSSADATHYQEHWAGYDVPRHLWHFKQKSMVLFLQKHGFTIQKILPMKLDAFYVSLLSEKYKQKGKTTLFSFIHAFFKGLSSNMQARSSGEYSSLIYIAKK